jgi:hypothetical protein
MNLKANSVDPDQMAQICWLIWIYTLLSCHKSSNYEVKGETECYFTLHRGTFTSVLVMLCFQSKIKLKVTYTPPAGAVPAVSAGAVSAAPAAPGAVVAQVDTVAVEEGPEEEEEGEEEDTGPPEIDPATGQPKPKPPKKKKMAKRRFRGKLSNKPQDFQV